MRRSSSKVTGRKIPESRNQPGSSLGNADSTGLIANRTDPARPPALAVRMRAVWLSQHLFSSGSLAFAQHISVELGVDFALFKQPHEFREDCWQVTL